ncbi:MAG: T9SS type A sorting domain-containing protein [Bacteroidetes bacterium]|nr:T9SS type A sorting domain-containing protein [Bacteroidota bacterium]
MARHNYTNEAPDGLSSIETQNPAFKSYPNPFSTQTILQCNTLVYNATLLVYNSLGQQVKQQNHLYGKEIKLYRENLPAGMYTIQVKQESKPSLEIKYLLLINYSA